MKLYTSFDLHSNNSFLGIKDENGKPVFKKKLPNDPERICTALRPYKTDIAGIVVESTLTGTGWWTSSWLKGTRSILPIHLRYKNIPG